MAGLLSSMLMGPAQGGFQAPVTQATVAPPPVAPRGLGGLFSGFQMPDQATRLQMAAQMMQGRNLGESVGGAFGVMGQNMADSRRKNATLEYFKRSRPDLAAAVEAGMPMEAAWAQAFGKSDKSGLINAGGGLIYDPNEKEWIRAPGVAAGIDEDAFKRERETRKDYGDEETVKNYTKVRDSYERVRAAAATDSGAGDIGLIFNYMKMLDPGSVVREGEFATAANAGGVSATILNYYNRALTGERLTPELREQFVGAADKLYGEASTNLSDVNTRYGDIARNWQIDPSRVIVAPEQYEPLKLGKAVKVAPGVTIKKVRD